MDRQLVIHTPPWSLSQHSHVKQGGTNATKTQTVDFIAPQRGDGLTPGLYGPVHALLSDIERPTDWVVAARDLNVLILVIVLLVLLLGGGGSFWADREPRRAGNSLTSPICTMVQQA